MAKNQKLAKDTEIFDAAAKAQGMAHVAELNAAAPVETAAPEAAKRGRKPSNRLTEAKFTAAVKDGVILPGMKYIDQKIEGNRVIYGHWETVDPIMALNETGELTLTRLFTGHKNRVEVEVLKTVSADKVMALLNSAE